MFSGAFDFATTLINCVAPTKKILLYMRYDEPQFIYSRFVRISYKMLIIKGISNEKTNELTIY